MFTGQLPVGSNRATYAQDFQVYDSEANQGFDLTTATIVVAVREPHCSPLLILTIGSGVVLTDAVSGFFEITFTAAQMRSLCAMTYEVGITVQIGDEVIQDFAGTLAVVDGIVN